MALSSALRLKPSAKGSVFHKRMRRIQSELATVNTNLAKIDVGKKLDDISTELGNVNDSVKKIKVDAPSLRKLTASVDNLNGTLKRVLSKAKSAKRGRGRKRRKRGSGSPAAAGRTS
jgi:hypothetical protein